MAALLSTYDYKWSRAIFFLISTPFNNPANTAKYRDPGVTTNVRDFTENYHIRKL